MLLHFQMRFHALHQLPFGPDFIPLLPGNIHSCLYLNFTVYGRQSSVLSRILERALEQLSTLVIHSQLTTTGQCSLFLHLVYIDIIVLDIGAILDVLPLLDHLLVVGNEALVGRQIRSVFQAEYVDRVELVGHLPIVFVQAQRNQHQDQQLQKPSEQEQTTSDVEGHHVVIASAHVVVVFFLLKLVLELVLEFRTRLSFSLLELELELDDSSLVELNT